MQPKGSHVKHVSRVSLTSSDEPAFHYNHVAVTVVVKLKIPCTGGIPPYWFCSVSVKRIRLSYASIL